MEINTGIKYKFRNIMLKYKKIFPLKNFRKLLKERKKYEIK